MANFYGDAAVELYYNGTKRFETTNTGIDVTGTVTSDGHTIAGDISASGGLSANNINSASSIISAGTDLIDIFGPGGSLSGIDGGGDACYLPVWSDNNTIGNSIACQSTGLLAVNGSLSSHGALSATHASCCNYFAGNVGINTTTPNRRLDVSSGMADSYSIRASYNDSYYLELAHNRINAVGNGYMWFNIADSTKMAINGTGLGIGTKSPGDKLTVQGNISAQGGVCATHASCCNYFAGNVGIGATDPAAKLTVQGTVSADGSLSAHYGVVVTKPGTSGSACLELKGKGNSTGDQVGIVEFKSHSGAVPLASVQGIRHNDDVIGCLAFSTSNSERVRIDNCGCVGIGITAPGEKLTVAGGISASGGLSAGKTSYFVDKVGIGTNTPNEALEVKGSIRIDNGASFTAYQVYRDNI